MDVYRRLDTQFDEVFREPVACTFSRLVAKKNEKVPIGVVLACGTKRTHEFVVGDAVDQHMFQPFDEAFCVTRLVTKLTARISRISDELKLISLMRFKISTAVRGTSLRNSGLI